MSTAVSFLILGVPLRSNVLLKVKPPFAHGHNYVVLISIFGIKVMESNQVIRARLILKFGGIGMPMAVARHVDSCPIPLRHS